MNDKKLIELVRHYPVLYDMSNLKYMNTDFKNNIWSQIGDEMGTTGQSCKTRWTNIRDNFRKSLKKNRTLVGQKAKIIKLYKYTEELSFLKNFIDHVVRGQDLSEDESDNIENSEAQLAMRAGSPVSAQFLCHTLSSTTQADSSLGCLPQSKNPEMSPRNSISKLKMNDKKLIELVRNYPVLYDVSKPKYMDTDHKNTIWSQIGEEMDATGQSCRTRWSNIRDNFRKSIKKNASLSGQKAQTRKLYKYSEQLSFLKKFFYEGETESKTVDEIRTKDSSDDEDKDSRENNEAQQGVGSPVVCAQSQCDSLTTLTAYPAQSKKPKLSLHSTDHPTAADPVVIEDFLKRTESAVPPSIQPPELVDAFLSGLAPALKKLPPRYWHYAKADIFAAVQKYELKMLMEEPSVVSHYSPPTHTEQFSPAGSNDQNIAAIKDED